MSDKGTEHVQPSAPYPTQASVPYPVQPQVTIEIPLQNPDNLPPPPPYYKPLPQANLYPVIQQQPSTVIIGPGAYSSIIGASPTRLRCPNCSADVLTSTNYRTGCFTWLIVGGICAAGLAFPLLCLGFQFIPFCVDGCKDVRHACPNCKAYIGTYDRLKWNL